MSLENAINTPAGEYIKGGFSATVQMPQTKQSKAGKAFYVATVADGAFRADVISFSQDFAKWDGHRINVVMTTKESLRSPLEIRPSSRA